MTGTSIHLVELAKAEILLSDLLLLLLKYYQAAEMPMMLLLNLTVLETEHKLLLLPQAP